MIEEGRDRRRLRRAIAREGAEIGVRMTRMYSGAFIVYATLRVAISILDAPPEGVAAAPTILATAASMVVASVTITSLLAIISIVVGATTSLAVHYTLVLGSSRGVRGRPLVVGITVAIASLAIGQLGMLPAIGFEPLALPLDTYLFWIGIPSIIYIVVATWMGRPLWRHVRAGRHVYDDGVARAIGASRAAQ